MVFLHREYPSSGACIQSGSHHFKKILDDRVRNIQYTRAIKTARLRAR